MQNAHKKIETLANIAIIVVALVLGVALVNRYFFNTSSSKSLPSENGGIRAGMKLPLADTDWNKSGKNLVLALSITCRYCTESTPFYQKIAQQKAERGNLRLIAVMPQGVDEARKYLNEQKIPVDEIKRANPSELFVRGTPTLILTDQTGAVVEYWTGKLPPEKEAEVLRRLFE